MAIAFNERDVPGQSMDGIRRQHLLSDERVPGARVRLDRLVLPAGATMRFDVPATSLAWLQLLEGEATLTAFDSDRLADRHSVFLPPGFSVTLSTAQDATEGATLLYADVPDAVRLDPGFAADPPVFWVLDWTREPVFVCEADARKRVFLVGPKICRTAAIDVAMVIYPPGSMAPSSHHEGADAFIYVLNGHGTGHANGERFSVRPGDLVYFPDREWRDLKASDAEEMRFLEFHVPGTFKTVWADPGKASAWVSTGRDIHNYETAADERERRVYAGAFGNPIIR